GEGVTVARKGATPAWPGQRGFIGGSMADISVIVEGVDSDEARAALHSTVHGAGRVMSRTQAAGKRRWVKKDGRRVQEIVKPGQVSREMMREWLRREGVELRGAGTDESPHVYRRLPEVLDAHAGSIRVLHTLRPLGVAMAGEDAFDPYTDSRRSVLGMTTDDRRWTIPQSPIVDRLWSTVYRPQNEQRITTRRYLIFPRPSRPHGRHNLAPRAIKLARHVGQVAEHAVE